MQYLPKIQNMRNQLNDNWGWIPLGPDKQKQNPLALFLGSIDSNQWSDEEEIKDQD